jgi:hypothetical protein
MLVILALQGSQTTQTNLISEVPALVEVAAAVDASVAVAADVVVAADTAAGRSEKKTFFRVETERRASFPEISTSCDLMRWSAFE